MIANTFPIDIVIAWVDGSDPVLNKKRMGFLNLKKKEIPPGAQPTRFHSLNEVTYCVLSILKFAPFIRKIFIVTDNQDPQVSQVVQQYYPNRVSDLRIVDHIEIFEGYEDFLPTFNSICISNMLWRIKGLSDQFVYFNDDIFLVRPVSPSVWFRKGKPVLRGRWAFPPYERILWDGFKAFVHNRLLNQNKERAASFQVNQWTAARLQGFRWRYFRSGHTPLALDKKGLGTYFKSHPKRLKENIKHRFRNYTQFNTVALANHLEYMSGNRNFAPSQAVYMQPHNRGEDYVNQKFEKCITDKQIKFLCVQSLDLATKADQDNVLNKMNQLLEIQLK